MYRKEGQKPTSKMNTVKKKVMRFFFFFFKLFFSCLRFQQKHFSLIETSLLGSESACYGCGIQMMPGSVRLFIIRLSSAAVYHRIPKSNFLNVLHDYCII